MAKGRGAGKDQVLTPYMQSVLAKCKYLPADKEIQFYEPINAWKCWEKGESNG